MKPKLSGRLVALTTAVFALTLHRAPAVVGYYNVPMPASGWRVVVMQLKQSNYNANTAFVNGPPPDGTLLYRYNPAAQDFLNAATYHQGVWYPVSGNTNDTVLELPLGEGFLVWSPQAWIATIVGEVPQGSFTNQLPLNYSLKGSIVPLSGQLETALGYPAHGGDRIYPGVPGAWDERVFDANDLVWYPSQPVLQTGQGFFVYRTIANQPWIRNFTVNRPAGSMPEPEPSPQITSFNIRDGIITLKIEKNSKRYKVQYSTDRETWTDVATNQTATTWRGPVPHGDRGFWQVTQP